MNPKNAELVQQLVKITKNLCFYSAHYTQLKPFIWGVDEQGILTLDKFLQSEGFLFPVKANILLEFVSSEASWSTWSGLDSEDSSTPSEVALKMSLKYTEIIDFLKSHLKTLEIYLVSNLGEGNCVTRKQKVKNSRIGNSDFYSLPVDLLHDSYKQGVNCIEQEAFHIIIGETFEGEWLGVAPQMYPGSYKRGGEKILLPEALLNENTMGLKRNLEEIVVGIEFSVIECLAFYRKQESLIEAGSTKQELLYRLLGSVGFISVFTFEDYCSENQNVFEEFHYFNDFFRANLLNLQEYIIGLNSTYFIYAIGHTEERDVLGISMRTIS